GDATPADACWRHRGHHVIDSVSRAPQCVHAGAPGTAVAGSLRPSATGPAPGPSGGESTSASLRLGSSSWRRSPRDSPSAPASGAGPGIYDLSAVFPKRVNPAITAPSRQGNPGLGA